MTIVSRIFGLGRGRLAAAALAVSAALSGLGVAGATAAPIFELVSVSTGGQQGNDISGRFAGPAMNADGQVVAFDSIATTLVPATPTGRPTSSSATGSHGHHRAGQRRQRRRPGQRLELPAERRRHGQAGRVRLLRHQPRAGRRQFRPRRVRAESVERRRRPASASRRPRSRATTRATARRSAAGGRFVAFVSTASNLVRNDTNGVEDIFVRDLVRGTTQRVSLTSIGEQANSSSTIAAISGNGRWVAFNSFATNLVPNDTNGPFDVFVHDRRNGLTERVSVDTNEAQANGPSARPSLSCGRTARSRSSPTPPIWSPATPTAAPTSSSATGDRHDRAGQRQQRRGRRPTATSQDPGVRGFTASGPDITHNGRFVAFFSSATNLVPGDTNTCPPSSIRLPAGARTSSSATGSRGRPSGSTGARRAPGERPQRRPGDQRSRVRGCLLLRRRQPGRRRHQRLPVVQRLPRQLPRHRGPTAAGGR